MSVFLKELSGYHRDEEIVLILDKAGWHTAANLNIPENITLHNKYFASLDAVEDQLADALKLLMEHPDQVKCVTLFDWMDN